MSKTKTAVIADIHANSWALEAVLEDIEKRNVSNIINLGDSLYGPLDPAKTYELIASSEMLNVAGNMDRYIIETQKKASNQTMQFVLDNVSSAAWDWLTSLPHELFLDDKLYACHGTPKSDEQPLLENIQPNCVTKKMEREIIPLINHIVANVILCAHTHMPAHFFLSNGKSIINPGSVGLPSYCDELPYKHKMESGGPHAKYCIIELEGHGLINLDQVSLKYNWQAASDRAKSLNRADWAHSLLWGIE